MQIKWMEWVFYVLIANYIAREKREDENIVGKNLAANIRKEE